jgi:hypothetical protein
MARVMGARQASCRCSRIVGWKRSVRVELTARLVFKVVSCVMMIRVSAGLPIKHFEGFGV